MHATQMQLDSLTCSLQRNSPIACANAVYSVVRERISPAESIDGLHTGRTCVCGALPSALLHVMVQGVKFVRSFVRSFARSPVRSLVDYTAGFYLFMSERATKSRSHEEFLAF